MPHLRILDFPTDIVELISSHVPKSDMSAWRLTCREICEAAAPFRLRDLVLRQYHVASASRYIARFPASALHIHSLCLRQWCNEDTPSDCLLLERAKNVTHLDLLPYCPILFEVVHKLPRLVHLELTYTSFEEVINLFQTPLPTLIRLEVYWSDHGNWPESVAASQVMPLLYQGTPALQILHVSLDMREPLGAVSVLPSIHTVPLPDSIGISTSKLLSIFPGMRNLTMGGPGARDFCTQVTAPLCVMESPQLDVLAGSIGELSWLHPYHMRATLLKLGNDEWCGFENDDADHRLALSHLLAGAQPQLLQLYPFCNDSRRLLALPRNSLPGVVVLHLTLCCTCLATEKMGSIYHTFLWVRFSSLLIMLESTDLLSET
jgi:hypothetical protein